MKAAGTASLLWRLDEREDPPLPGLLARDGEMILSGGTLDEAYVSFEEWRPKRHVRRDERLAARLSTLTPKQIE